MISMIDIFVIKWTDEKGVAHEERLTSEEKMFKRSQELRADGIDFERYKLTTVESRDITTVKRPI